LPGTLLEKIESSRKKDGRKREEVDEGNNLTGQVWGRPGPNGEKG